MCDLGTCLLQFQRALLPALPEATHRSLISLQRLKKKKSFAASAGIILLMQKCCSDFQWAGFGLYFLLVSEGFMLGCAVLQGLVPGDKFFFICVHQAREKIGA